MSFHRVAIASVIILCLLISACGARHAAPQPIIPPTPDVIPPDTTITLIRNGCVWVECPDYQLRIFADGTVVFHGYENVRQLGQAEATIPLEHVRMLLDTFEQVDYFTLRDEYTGMDPSMCDSYFSEGSEHFTSIVLDGQTKSVRRNTGCEFEERKQLAYLEKMIDVLANSKQWID